MTGESLASRPFPNPPPKGEVVMGTESWAIRPLPGPLPKRDWGLWLWGLLLVLAVTAVHAFYWTNLRMRAPLMPVVALAAALGAEWLVARIGNRKRPRSNELRR